MNNQMNTPAYIERLDLNNSGKKSSTVAMFKPLEWKDCWLGVWELDGTLTESGKKERLYFMLVNDGVTCGVYMSDEVDRIMRPYHVNHMKRIIKGHDDSQQSDPYMTVIVAAAFTDIVMRRYDVPCKFMCPSLDWDFPVHCWAAMKEECEEVTFKAFSKKGLKMESANVYFKMKKDQETIFHAVQEMFFKPKAIAA